jgi:hypothetical protein
VWSRREHIGGTGAGRASSRRETLLAVDERLDETQIES